VKAILDKVLEMGDGDIIVGSIKAVDAGVIDSPFHSNLHIRDRVLGAKDSKGGVRYVEFGNLPLPEEVKKFHREKLAERERGEGRKMDYRVSIADMLSFSKGKLLGAVRSKEIQAGNEISEALP
jgi:methylaspartate mutase epsilon subunit